MLISYYWKTGISLSAWGCGWSFIKTIHKKVVHRLLASLCCRQLPAKEERLQPNILVRILFYSVWSMITFVLGFLFEEMRGHPKELSWFCGLRAPTGICGWGPGTGWWHSPHPWIRRLFRVCLKKRLQCDDYCWGSVLQWFRALRTFRICKDLHVHAPRLAEARPLGVGWG